MKKCQVKNKKENMKHENKKRNIKKLKIETVILTR